MKQWYYMVDSDRKGPITEKELLNLFNMRLLDPDALVWNEELEDWMEAQHVDNLLSPGIGALPMTAAHMHSDGSQPQAIFLHVPIARLVWMSIVSWGLYEIYWIYKNWRYLKERDGRKISPFWRGVFGIFFINSLFKAIHEDQHTNAIAKATFSASALATGWIILMLLGSSLNRADDTTANLLGTVLVFPSFLFFIPVQNYINRVNDALNPKPAYSPWSAGHIVCLVLGILIWPLAVAGFLLPQ